MAQESHKSELIAELALARQAISANVRGLKQDLNLVRRLETAFQAHRLVWLTGVGMIGFLLARLPARCGSSRAPRLSRKPPAQESVVKAGLLVTVLKLAFDVGRPVLTKWLTRRVAAYAGERFENFARDQDTRR